MSEPEVLIRIEGAVGRITLNRPAALHALTTNMVALITEALQTWVDNSIVKVVLFDHTGERGFCAGGDIRMLAESGAGDGRLAREFFFTEYRLNHLLFHYPKPRVAIGIGVNWISPFGPLRLDLAKAIVKQRGDETKLFSFNVGTQF